MSEESTNLVTGESADNGPALQFTYYNHRGESAVRTVVPGSIYYGSNFYYPDPQWLLEAFDVDRGETRSFALACIMPGDIAADVKDFVGAVLSGSNPRLDEPYATLGLCLRKLTTQMHERASKLDEVLIENVNFRQANARLDAENRALRAGTHEIDELKSQIEALTGEITEMREVELALDNFADTQARERALDEVMALFTSDNSFLGAYLTQHVVERILILKGTETRTYSKNEVIDEMLVRIKNAGNVMAAESMLRDMRETPGA